MNGGVNTSEFSGFNDGEYVSAKTCRKVAEAITKHAKELSEQEREWLLPHVEWWKTCGGCWIY